MNKKIFILVIMTILLNDCYYRTPSPKVRQEKGIDMREILNDKVEIIINKSNHDVNIDRYSLTDEEYTEAIKKALIECGYIKPENLVVRIYSPLEMPSDQFMGFNGTAKYFLYLNNTEIFLQSQTSMGADGMPYQSGYLCKCTFYYSVYNYKEKIDTIILYSELGLSDEGLPDTVYNILKEALFYLKYNKEIK